MEIPIFEKELKALDLKFSIVPHPVNKDMAGIYWNSVYVCAVPSGHIYDERKSAYVDAIGNVHRTRPEAIGQAKRFLWRLQNEPDFLETVTEPL